MNDTINRTTGIMILLIELRMILLIELGMILLIELRMIL